MIIVVAMMIMVVICSDEDSDIDDRAKIINVSLMMKVP